MTSVETDAAPRRRSLVAAAVIVGTGIALAAAYFPLLFNQFQLYDDEGVFNTSLRLLLNDHGSLYAGIWADKFGPFYYLFTSSIYRVLGQQPTVENGRWIALGLATASATIFAASVWRVTKSLPAGVLCEVASFLILVKAAGSEPMHPGTVAVMLVAVVVYAFASYSGRRKNAYLVLLGAATAALLLTILLTGLLVVVAIVTVFVAGNEKVPRRARVGIVVAAALVPIAVTIKRISEPWVGTLGLLVLVAVVGISMSILIDGVTLPKRWLRAAVIGIVAIGAVSAGFALVTGTHVGQIVQGVLVAPWRQGFELTLPAVITVTWLAVIVTAVGLYAALGVWRDQSSPGAEASLLRRRLLLAAVGAVLLGLGTTATSVNWSLGQWLPVLALLPALALAGALPEPVRFALRAMTLVAALQVLVAYPVARSQIAWATVAMTVPCAVAVAAGLEYASVWKRARGSTQALTTGGLCLALVFMTGAWPPTIWKDYLDTPSLGLPGTHLVRVATDERTELRTATNILRAKCDTFYSVPAMNSFYLFSAIAPLTGLVANYPGALTAAQQQRVAKRLEALSRNKHVCILRDLSRSDTVAVGYGKGPLHDELSRFTRVIATVGDFSISRKNRAAVKQTRQRDPFLCYEAQAGSGFDPPANASIVDQFNPKGLDAKFGAVDLQCNPTTLGAVAAAKLDNPDGHLLCSTIGATAPRAIVLATNRLGTARLEIKSARGLCMPSWSSTTGPPDRADPAPPGLGQLSCYRIGYVKRGGRFRTPATVVVNDRYSATPVPAVIAGPRLLCLSASVGGGGSRSAPTSTAQYVCFAAGPTPTKTPVYDQNEFGAGSVRVGNTEMLCLPSTKKVLVSPRG